MPTAKHWSTVASTVNTTLFPPSDEWHFACTQSSRVHQAKQEGVAACHKPCNLQWSDKTEVSISYTQSLDGLGMCAAVWSSTISSARDPGFSFPQPTPTHLTALAAPAARAKTTSGTQDNLGSISAVSRVQSSMLPEKSSFERMSGGSFSKQRLLIEPIKDKRGRPNGYIQSERKKASVLFTSMVSLLWGHFRLLC